MAHIINEPLDFVPEMIDGLVAASGRWLRRVPGGVARATPSAPGTVAVIIGGGSGHYPAFAGLIGPGLAHGAALGNVFASPSAQQVYDVARACDAGGGILFTYGNYAGDVLNFDEAQALLRAEGTQCETVVVTDDISSAPADQAATRRGIAGDLTVFKVAAAAADEGADLAAVTAIARRANARTRSMGVAFSGCTLPGATTPLFSVPAGRMGVGMGIHGEPGIREAEVLPAAELARLLVTAVLAEAPADPQMDMPKTGRVAVILNGLGSVKYEELFVLYRSVSARLREAGLVVIDPEVGEVVTSFDMAGVSLTLTWLDDELERLWRAPADCAGYRKQATDAAPSDAGPPASATAQPAPGADRAAGDAAGPPAAAATPESAAVAQFACRALAAAEESIREHADELGQLDAIAGDGDHGIGMLRGVSAARRAADDRAAGGAGLHGVIAAAASSWADQGGGTSGALWGVLLRTVAGKLDDRTVPSPGMLALAVHAAADAIRDRGHAEPGDKTMLDALIPVADVFAASLAAGDDLRTAWERAVTAGEAAASATAELLPRIGRARPHAERSLGSPDPGAVSLALVARALLTTGLNARPGAVVTTAE